MSIYDSFRRQIEEYLVAADMTASDFGRLTVGDSGFVLEVRRGRSPRVITVDRVLAWIESNPVAKDQLR